MRLSIKGRITIRRFPLQFLPPALESQHLLKHDLTDRSGLRHFGKGLVVEVRKMGERPMKSPCRAKAEKHSNTAILGAAAPDLQRHHHLTPRREATVSHLKPHDQRQPRLPEPYPS